jgi:penicillin amidase
MLNATSVDEIDESMRGWVDPCNNFVFADVHGDIGYLNRGKVPIRSMANAWLPVPGWTGEHEWQGFIPFEELARSRNPDTGFIVTANNRIVGEEYPYYLSLDSAPEYRARRISQRLESMRNATTEDMAAVHAEKVSIPAATYSELLSQVEPLDKFSSRAVERLAGWDGTMDKDAVAPTIYCAFRFRLHRMIAGHLLGPLADEAFLATGRGAPGHLGQLAARLVTAAPKNDTSLLPPGTDWKSLAARALADGVADLRQRLGDDIDSWLWGRVHHTAPRHALSNTFPDLASLLDPPSFPMGGDGDTPQAGGYGHGRTGGPHAHARVRAPSNPFVMTGMSVARYVFDTGDWNSSAWIIPLGASGHPGSPHYADQAPTWAEVKLIPMLYDWSRIEATAESHQALEQS